MPTTLSSKLPAEGSYVRAWVRDLALALGTLGHVVELRRLQLGPFSAQSAISLDKLESLGHSPAALEHLKPISTALDGIPALAVTGPDSVRLRSGNAILIRTPHFARLMEGPQSAPSSRPDGPALHSPG